MDSFITQIERFCREHQLSESQFGVLALNDKNLVPQVRTGRDLRVSTMRRIQDWMDAQARDRAA